MSGTRTRPTRRAGLRLVFLAAVGALTLGAVELGFRVVAARQDERLQRAFETLDGSEVPRGGEMATFREIVRLSANHRIIYELIPNLDVTFLAPLTTNAAGFRGAPIPVAKPPRTVRIVGLGDSVMFGWGVRDDETYLEVLARRLRERRPDVRWEVLNTGVPGYNTVMQVETLRARALAYDPDLVLINYVENDLDLPNFIRARRDYGALDRSFLLAFLRGRGLGPHPGGPHWLADAPHPAGPDPDRRHFESDPALVPAAYRDHVGLEAYRRAMGELARLSHERDFEVFVFGHPGLPSHVREVATELGLPFGGTGTFLTAFVREHGLESGRDDRLYVSPTDRHPSALGHRVIGLGLHRLLRRGGFVDRLATRVESDPGLL